LAQQASGNIRVTFSQALGMLGPYVKDKIVEQIKSVWLIVAYLVLFQMVILGIPIADASVISVGIGLVIIGLAFFMEGLMLGLMPLGELVGVKLPQKSNIVVILLFAIGLGFLATLAEPAISVLKAAGAAVLPWEAPLLFIILNKESATLVNMVGCGVGIAVMFGMMRFMYGWSLKPFIYIMVGGLSVFTIFASFNPNLLHLTGLAWDCGAVTTGPVTVPLVLALGIGISRMVGDSDGGASGFGVVTLASLFPILMVISLGLLLIGNVPQPSAETDFFRNEKAIEVFGGDEYRDEMVAYAMKKGSIESQNIIFDGDTQEIDKWLKGIASDDEKAIALWGSKDDFLKWSALSSSPPQKLAVFGNQIAVDGAIAKYSSQEEVVDVKQVFIDNFMMAAQAILLLGIPMILVLFVVLREKLPRPDETMLGLSFAIIGMAIFSVGISFGLDKLGKQVGQKLPSSFTQIKLEDNKKTIANFDKSVVQTALDSDGNKNSFFYAQEGPEIKTIPFKEEDLNTTTGQLNYIPTRGPLFGEDGGLVGILVVLLFAFIMGYGATLAEPALNALGSTVEELTVGTFKKSLLMQAVALGVGAGITLGVAKIIWNIPLIWMMGPPYLLLLIITKLSTEEFVNIGWDSAGVTTGPITVPLVLAMGLAVGQQVGVVEGFGILSMASVCPILSVLCVGLVVTKRREALVSQSKVETELQAE